MYRCQQPHRGGTSLARKSMIDWQELHRSGTLFIVLIKTMCRSDGANECLKTACNVLTMCRPDGAFDFCSVRLIACGATNTLRRTELAEERIGRWKIAPIEVGYRVATKSGKTAEESSADALQKKKQHNGVERSVLLLVLLITQYPISGFI